MARDHALPWEVDSTVTLQRVSEWRGPDGRYTPAAEVSDGILRGPYHSFGVDVAAERPRV